MQREYTLELKVRAPTTTGESDITDGINGALDEPPCDWGEWVVGTAEVTRIVLVPDGDAETETEAQS
jgi:hypothetical protein